MRSNAALWHWPRKARPQRHWCGSSRGRNSSGESARSSQRATFSGAAGLTQGSQWLTEICAPLAWVVSSAASGWRSITVTRWPSASRCQAVLMPTMPAPRTMTCMRGSTAVRRKGQAALCQNQWRFGAADAAAPGLVERIGLALADGAQAVLAASDALPPVAR